VFVKQIVVQMLHATEKLKAQAAEQEKHVILAAIV
jgi:hypothetical protein